MTDNQHLIDQVVQRAHDADLNLIRFLYTDNGGIIRGKATHIKHLRNRISDGIGLTVAMQSMNMLDQPATVSGMGPVGEIRLIPDPTSFKLLPYARKAGAMTVDMITLDGDPWGACPRSFLKRQIAAARAMGITLQMSAEFEWSLAKQTDDGGFVPVDAALCFASTAMTIAHDLTADLVDALEAQGITVEQYYPELGHGQQELSIRHTDPLTAADNHIFTRETIRNVSYAHGLYASLAPKPFLDQAGNGGHIHFSLWDADGKRNLMYDGSDHYGVSKLGKQFIAGVLDHLPGLLAITCASYNSYHRLQAHSWSSAFTAWGHDNREGAVRVASRYKSDEEGSANAELKAADLSMNPFIAFGALIAAGLDGVRRELDPGEATNVDPGTLSEAERAARGIQRFPETLGAALDALAADSVLLDALSPLLAESYLAVKRLEFASFEAEDAAFETRHHFWKF